MFTCGGVILQKFSFVGRKNLLEEEVGVIKNVWAILFNEIYHSYLLVLMLFYSIKCYYFREQAFIR